MTAGATRTQRVEQPYKFFKPELRSKTYNVGDVYSNERQMESRQAWAVPDLAADSYLMHIKSLCGRWPHLRLLADFMEVGTTPARWKDYPDDVNERDRMREKRWEKTNVCRIEYLQDGTIRQTTFDESEHLRKAMGDLGPDKEVKFRLFVVEDLSRYVIEHLGTGLNIEPAFFREHIVDFAWYNVRDPWRDPPNLSLVSKRQPWFQLRFVRPRYFESGEVFNDGFKDASNYNVLRRPDDDENNIAFWDKTGGKVGMTRSRATFWMRRAESENETSVGVLLLDPTTSKGFPLWQGYRDWTATPGIGQGTPEEGPSRRSFFEDFIYWAQRPAAFPSSGSGDPSSAVHVPAQALLHLVCAEWLTLADYVKTRLSQIDWEIAYPEHFLFKGNNIDIALKKLHIWRRFVPLYREMLSETLLRVFHYPCHPLTPFTAMNGFASQSNSSSSTTCTCPVHSLAPEPAGTGTITAYKQEFALALAYMEEYQQRIDRLTHVVTATINIDDARRGYKDNRNLSRLTWLATLFIPLGFIATLLSMQPDVTVLEDTVKYWAKAAVPTAVATLVLVLLLSMNMFERWFDACVDALKKWVKGFPWIGKWRPLADSPRAR